MAAGGAILDRDGVSDLDRRAVPPQRRGPAVPRRRRAQLLGMSRLVLRDDRAADDMRVGAGISGLTAGKALSRLRGLPYTCFEASDDVGGNWYFGNPNGRSRPTSRCTSTPPATASGSATCRWAPTTRLPHHEQINEYLEGYADAFALREGIRFRPPSSTLSASPAAAGGSRSAAARRRTSTSWSSATGTTGTRATRTSRAASTARRFTPTTTSPPPSPWTSPASACWSSGSATAPWTSSRSSRARASRRRSTSRLAAAPG